MLNIVYIQMIKAKKVNVMWRSLLLLSPLNRRLAWRKQRILRSMKLMLVAPTMMKVTKTLLIQKRVNQMMTRVLRARIGQAASPLKTPPGKKARITTPSVGKKNLLRSVTFDRKLV
ncbi:uncharacterized protein LOC100276804 [Zea mays]|uniref:Uncharacterized protein n=1 Tax=Zea mays TaxID=4577 RepID=B6UFU0_MAIZE|nr:uncharacterized protein LOC100276804 [Zea mays]ACG48223.1 hypothetical protein [Zea mays]